MTFYLHPHPFNYHLDRLNTAAQGRPHRRIARRWVESNEHTLGINIREEDDAYVLSALVPGLKSEDLNIQVLDDVIRIEGEYTGVAIGSDNVAHPIWTDFRGQPGVTSPNQDAVTISIPLP